MIDTGENDDRHFRLMVDSPSTGGHLDVLWTLGDRTDQIVRTYMDRFVAKGLKPTKRLAEFEGRWCAALRGHAEGVPTAVLESN